MSAEEETKLNRLIRRAHNSTSLPGWKKIIKQIVSTDECFIPEGYLGRLPLHSLVLSTTVATTESIADTRREALWLCLEKFPAALLKRDVHGHTVLHIACASAEGGGDDPGRTRRCIDTEVVRMLTTPPLGDPALLTSFIHPGTSPTEGEAEEFCSTPLHTACESRPSRPVLGALAAAGDAWAEALLQRDGQDQLPIHVAVDYGASLPAVQFLVEQWRKVTEAAQPNGARGSCSLMECGLDNYRPLHFACNPGVDEETFSYIVRTAPMTMWRTTRTHGDLPINIAVSDMPDPGFLSSHSATAAFKVRTLLQAAGHARTDMIRMQNVHGSTALHVACGNGQLADWRIVEKFLALCPELSSQPDGRGDTPLHYAATVLGDPQVLRALIRHEKQRNARGRCEVLLLPNHAGCLPLDLVNQVIPASELKGRHRQIKAILAKETKRLRN